MPHDKSLIDAVMKKIKSKYNENEHEYIIENRLYKSDKKFYPDIQVLDRNKNIKCIVEIGYTRPEKLDHYRKLKIDDIRWYSKNLELINPQKIESKIIRQTPDDLSIWEYVMFTCNDVSIPNIDTICDNADCRYDAFQEHICDKFYENCFMNQAHIDGGDRFWKCESCFFLNYEEEEDLLNELSEYYAYYGLIATNGKNVFIIVVCDECGGVYFIEDLIEVQYYKNGYSECFSSYLDFLKLKNKLKKEYYELKYNRNDVKSDWFYGDDLKFSELEIIIKDLYRVDLDFDKSLIFEKVDAFSA